jgi:hypothetical protein
VHDDADDVSLISRLLDENEQLKEENRQLRTDMEHMIRVIHQIQREATT